MVSFHLTQNTNTPSSVYWLIGNVSMANMTSVMSTFKQSLLYAIVLFIWLEIKSYYCTTGKKRKKRSAGPRVVHVVSRTIVVYDTNTSNEIIRPGSKTS